MASVNKSRGLNEDSPHLLAPPGTCLSQWARSPLQESNVQATWRVSDRALGGRLRRVAELPSRKVFSFHQEWAWVTNLAQTPLLSCTPLTAPADTSSRAVSVTEVNWDCPSRSWMLKDMGACWHTQNSHALTFSARWCFGLITTELIEQHFPQKVFYN